MLGFPAAATKVGNQSRPDMIPFDTDPGLTCPGQRISAGTRNEPSVTCPFAPENGVVPPSGQVYTSAPLSVVNTTIVLSSSPLSLIHFRTTPMLSSICRSAASSRPKSVVGLRIPSYFGDR